MEPKRAIVVLGAHRSGTSAIARGLVALGVDLGDRLLPPLPDNPKGFWEDRDVLALDEEILAAAGRTWHGVSAMPLDREDPALAPFARRAADILRDRFSARSIWGVKDPRMARLLPLWQAAFARLELADAYVIAFRGPESVCASLGRRNGFPRSKSELLWLTHCLGALLGTRGRPAVVVDYDRMLDTPEDELGRVARALGLAVRQERVADYLDFLSSPLRHHRDPDEGGQSSAAPFLLDGTRALHELLAGLSRDERRLDDPGLEDELGAVRAELDALEPLLAHLDVVETELEHERAAHRVERDEHRVTREALDRERAARRSLRHSFSFRLGRALTFPVRRIADATRDEPSGG